MKVEIIKTENAQEKKMRELEIRVKRRHVQKTESECGMALSAEECLSR